ncbi:hypothetical protein J3F83DRAFT_548878 [Trichoderma novae-zelandiae]
MSCPAPFPSFLPPCLLLLLLLPFAYIQRMDPWLLRTCVTVCKYVDGTVRLLPPSWMHIRSSYLDKDDGHLSGLCYQTTTDRPVERAEAGCQSCLVHTGYTRCTARAMHRIEGSIGSPFARERKDEAGSGGGLPTHVTDRCGHHRLTPFCGDFNFPGQACVPRMCQWLRSTEHAAEMRTRYIFEQLHVPSKR